MVLLCWNCKQRCTDFVGDTKTPKFPFRKKHPEKTNKETQKKMRHENKLIQHTTHWLYLVAAVAYQTNSIWSLWHARVHRQIKFIFLHLAVRTMLFSHCALWSSFVLFHHASGIERGLNEFVCQAKKKEQSLFAWAMACYAGIGWLMSSLCICVVCTRERHRRTSETFIE